MLTRIGEPAAADPKLEANVYRDMDHREVNLRFVTDLLDAGPVGPRIIDLGCGPALIPILLCEVTESRAESATQIASGSGGQIAIGSGVEISAASPPPPVPLRVMGVDHCIEMLELARLELEFAGRTAQIQLEQIDLSDPDGLPMEIADTVISNTVLHHLDDPSTALRVAWKALRLGGRLFVRDLFRPASAAEVERLVALHGGPEEECKDGGELATNGVVDRRSVSPSQLLRQSLYAALTLDEIKQMVEQLGIDRESVAMTSDRHWTLDCVRPATS